MSPEQVTSLVKCVREMKKWTKTERRPSVSSSHLNSALRARPRRALSKQSFMQLRAADNRGPRDLELVQVAQQESLELRRRWRLIGKHVSPQLFLVREGDLAGIGNDVQVRIAGRI